jgi:hypothetical protein
MGLQVNIHGLRRLAGGKGTVRVSQERDFELGARGYLLGLLRFQNINISGVRIPHLLDDY